MYEVILLPKARKVYASSEQALARKLARCFQVLEDTPRQHPNIKGLRGSLIGHYRYRLGDYRVVYSVDDREKKVYIIRIVHRREAYG